MKIKNIFAIAMLFFAVSLFVTSCKDACEGVVCQNGGTCNEGDCDCPAGFTGTLCQTPADPCDVITCQNGGTCVNGTCNCPAGFIGTFCETADPCFGVNCQNGGTCVNGVCDCPPGISGANCENWDAENFEGTYTVVEQCPAGQITYTVVVSKDLAQTDKIFFSRMNTLANPTTPIYADVDDADSFTIPSQTVDNYTFSGSGQIVNMDDLSVSLTVSVAGGTPQTCTVNYIR